MGHVSLARMEPCVWMAAGLVSYKLCDHDFDCTRCPLDAALRGSALATVDAATWPDAGRRSQGFPVDRRYAPGHTWIRFAGRAGDLARIGLDGFAAALLPRPARVSVDGRPRGLERGDIICDIELPDGTFPVVAPIAGRLERANAALHEHPELVIDSPYHDGWLVELTLAEDVDAVDDLTDAAQAREDADLQLRHFRRRIGLQLLSDTASVGPCMADGGEVLTSLCDIVGGRRYLRILREVLR